MGTMLHFALCDNQSKKTHAPRGCCCTTFEMQAITNEDDLLLIMHTATEYY